MQRLITTGAEPLYFALPWNSAATGFFFRSLDEYQTQADICRDADGHRPATFTLTCIEGPHAALFNALELEPARLADWFDYYANFDPTADSAAIYIWLRECEYDHDTALELIDDYEIIEGTLGDFAREELAHYDTLPDYVRDYIDFDWLGYDKAYEWGVQVLPDNRLIVEVA